MGLSIAAKGMDWATGSAGGYVELRLRVQKSLCCIITCHQVLRPTKPRHEGSSPDTAAGLIDPIASAVAEPPECDPTLNQEGIFHPAVATPGRALEIDQQGSSEYQAKLKESANLKYSDESKIVEIEEEIEIGMSSASILKNLKVLRERVAT